MIYMNNAATTYPKPQCVLDAHAAALCTQPESQFRSGSELGADQSGNVFDRCRKNLAKILGIREENSSRVFFSSGATDSANKVLYGLLRGKIITTATEHNSILRPLYNHPEWKRNLTIIGCDKFGRVSPDELETVLSETADQSGANERVQSTVIVNHCSNVTGMVQDLHGLAEAAHRKGALFIADVSQSAGCMIVDADEIGIDALIFTGHKSLFGVQGTGGYYVRSGIAFKPLEYGGTGRNSSQLKYGTDYEYEVGTQNEPGICALCAGTGYILERGISNIEEDEQRQMKLLYDGLTCIPGVKTYGSAETNKGPVLSCNVNGMKPSDTAYILQNVYDVTVRTGLHCAPLIHEYIGSAPYGTVRVSISALTKDEDIHSFLTAMSEIAMSVSENE